MSLATLDFESQYLHMNTKIGIILPNLPHGADPKTFYAAGEKYRVLWLLHGTYGDYSDWIRKSKIELYACKHNLIVVMPSGLNANYINWPKFGQGYEMEDHLVRELIPLITSWFPASDKREDNFIAGLSMGGNGALIYALNHPEKFAKAAVLSSSAREYSEAFLSEEREKGKCRFDNMVSMMGGMEEFLSSKVNVRRTIVELMAAGKEKALPELFFAYGDKDHGYAEFLSFLEFSRKQHFPLTYEVIPGYRHEWRFWDLAIQDALYFFGIGERTERCDGFQRLNG